MEAKQQNQDSKTLVWMHAADDWANKYIQRYVSNLFPVSDNVRVLFLQAHTLKGVFPEWFRINSLAHEDTPEKRNLTDLALNSEAIKRTIDDEMTLMYSHLSVEDRHKRIYLGGFSQGAMMSLYLQLMKFEYPLGGVSSFAGYEIYPLWHLQEDSVSKEEAKKTVSCLSNEMRFMFWHG